MRCRSPRGRRNAAYHSGLWSPMRRCQPRRSHACLKLQASKQASKLRGRAWLLLRALSPRLHLWLGSGRAFAQDATPHAPCKVCVHKDCNPVSLPNSQFDADKLTAHPFCRRAWSKARCCCVSYSHPPAPAPAPAPVPAPVSDPAAHCLAVVPWVRMRPTSGSLARLKRKQT